MKNKSRHQLSFQKGISITEYGLIITVIVLSLLIFMTDIGSHIMTLFVMLGLDLNGPLMSLNSPK